jgi:hypothetical protein
MSLTPAAAAASSAPLPRGGAGETGGRRAAARCLPLFRRGGWYDSLDREAVVAAPGSALLSQAPPVLLRDDAAWLRRSLLPGPGAAEPWRPERSERARLVALAMEMFAGVAGGAAGDSGAMAAVVAAGGAAGGGGGLQTVATFARDLDRCCGLPPALVRRWTGLLAAQAARLAAAGGTAGELPPGTLALVSLPANTFVCLEAVLELALRGAAVWIRPSRREPFAALRLVACLLAAGWPRHLLGLYPTAHPALATLVRLADLAVLYGGPDLAAELAPLGGRPGGGEASSGRGREASAGALGAGPIAGAVAGSRPVVEIRGPGRARAVVAETCAAAAAAETLLALVAGDSGRFCTSVGTILCTHATAEIGRDLAARLDALPLAAPRGGGEWRWPLAAWPEEAPALATAAWIAERLRPGDRFVTRRPLLQRRSGRVLLAPALVALASPDGHPLLGVELPFPFAVIAAAPPTPGARQPAGCAGVRPELLAGARFLHSVGAGGASALLDLSSPGAGL